VSNGDDIPSLTLRVLERIQENIATMTRDMAEMKGDLKALNTRFEHFLELVGRDVQDLKTRVTALEQTRHT
jgi:hypothetical protein